MTTRRVLMLSPHFPPDARAGTHRVRLLAPRLAEHGWEPVVVTVEPRYYESELDHELAAMLPDDLRVVRARAIRPGLTRQFGESFFLGLACCLGDGFPRVRH